jgi:hypothetical protein
LLLLHVAILSHSAVICRLVPITRDEEKKGATGPSCKTTTTAQSSWQEGKQQQQQDDLHDGGARLSRSHSVVDCRHTFIAGHDKDNGRLTITATSPKLPFIVSPTNKKDVSR